MSEEKVDDPFEGLADDYPCRKCGSVEDFTAGLERCDDQPCEELIAWNKKPMKKMCDCTDGHREGDKWICHICGAVSYG